MRLIDGKNRDFVPTSVSHNTLNRISTVDVGTMLHAFGGGGRWAFGTCRLPYDEGGGVLAEIMAKIFVAGR